MPIERCTRKNGKSGFKVHNAHTCFATRKEALKQLRAIEISKHGAGQLSLADKVAIEVLVNKEEERLNKEFGEDDGKPL